MKKNKVTSATELKTLAREYIASVLKGGSRDYEVLNAAVTVLSTT